MLYNAERSVEFKIRSCLLLPQIQIIFLNKHLNGVKTSFCIMKLCFRYLLVKLSEDGGQGWHGIDVSWCIIKHYSWALQPLSWGQVKVEEMTSCRLLPEAWYLMSTADNKPSECTKVWCLIWLHNWSTHPRLNYL